MDELNKNTEQEEEKTNSEETTDLVDEKEEYGFSDKIVGVLSEPGELFSSLSGLPVKTIDWFLPVLFVVIVAVISNFVLMGDPEIKANMIEKQMEQIEKNFQEAVDAGRMSQEQADQQLDNIQQRMEEGGSGQLLISSVGIVIVTFIIFFIITEDYLLVARMIFIAGLCINWILFQFGFMQ